MKTFEEKYQIVKKIIQESSNICFFCGAGISTASGIPDFRSENGLYSEKNRKKFDKEPEYFLSIDCLKYDTERFFEFYKQFMDARNYEPNAAHKFMALMEQQGKSLGIVTQNIDMLNEKAGCQNIFKVHGTIGSNRCMRCGRKYGIDTIFDSKETIPKCTCQYPGNYIRPEVVLYGEGLPEMEVYAAYDAIGKADCLIICGTSLTVQPMASAIKYVGELRMEADSTSKSKIIVLNKTPLDFQYPHIDVQINEDMTNVFERLLKDFS